jgi:anti-anti-sigma factor
VADLLVQISNRDEALILTLIGPGDLLGAGILDKNLLAISAQRPTRVVVDLGGLSFISSIFMGSLIRLRQSVGHSKGKVVMCGASETVLDALKRARLDQVFEIHPAVDDAVRGVCQRLLSISSGKPVPALRLLQLQHGDVLIDRRYPHRRGIVENEAGDLVVVRFVLLVLMHVTLRI